jgi:hypothetical protein
MLRVDRQEGRGKEEKRLKPWNRHDNHHLGSYMYNYASDSFFSFGVSYSSVQVWT